MGISEEKLTALADYDDSSLFDEKEKAALRYADAMTLSDTDVSDEQFEALRQHFSDDALVELTAVIAWENASAKFNRAMRIPSQGLWKRSSGPG